MEKSFSKVALALLFLSIFTLVVVMVPVAKAQSASITLTPSEGPPGTQVLVAISNFQNPDTVTIKLGTITVGTLTTSYGYPVTSMGYTIPVITPGKYTVTAAGSEGDSATATFTVTQGFATATPGQSQPGTSTTAPSGASPTYIAVTPYGGVPSKSGFWSPLAIGIVAFVVAVACFTTVVFVRRGRQGPVSVENDSSYKPRPSAENTQPFKPKSTVQETSSYGYRSSTQQTSPYGYRSSAQQTSPYSYRPSVPPTRYTTPPQFNQTATNRPQPPAHTKICKHCKREVREDLNVCPYCLKKLK
jgi:hypothetical protein